MTQSVKITWNESAIRRLAEEAGQKAMEVAQTHASQIRCLDHADIVRVLERDPRTGAFRLQACCEAAKRTALEAIERAFS
jgi:hypothetical protein